jgi:hypothetical protein
MLVSRRRVRGKFDHRHVASDNDVGDMQLRAADAHLASLPKVRET